MFDAMIFTSPWCICIQRMEFILNDMISLGKRNAFLFTPLLNTTFCRTAPMKTWRTLNKLSWSQCNSEYEIRICFQIPLTIVPKYNPDIIFHTLSKELSVLQQQCLRAGYDLYLLSSICHQGMTALLGARHSYWWWFPKQHLHINPGINSVG